MSFIDIINLFPNLYKLEKVWEFEFGKTLFFGSKNASRKLRFTNNHNGNVNQ